MNRFFNSRKKFSLENAQFLVGRVGELESQAPSGTDQRITELVDSLRELVEVVVWGDKNDDSVFDVFLECQIMSTFAKLIIDDFPSEVKVQVIQCVIILVQNLTRKESVFFVLSNNHINKIITTPFDVDNEELISNFVSFLKSLALRLTNETVQFFLDRQENTLPLYDVAVSLMVHDDRMVRTSSRQIVMSTIQLTDETVNDFLKRCGHVFVDQLSAFIIQQITFVDKAVQRIDRFATDDSAPEGHQRFLTISFLDSLVEDIIDDLFYLNDLMECGNQTIEESIHAAVESKLMNRLLDGAAGKKPEESDGEASSTSQLLSVVLLAHWLRTNTNKALQEKLIVALFGEEGSSIDDSLILKLIGGDNFGLIGPALAVLGSAARGRVSPDWFKSKMAGTVMPKRFPLKADASEQLSAAVPELESSDAEADPAPVRLGAPLKSKDWSSSKTGSILLDTLFAAIQKQLHQPDLCRLSTLSALMNAALTYDSAIEPDKIRQSLEALVEEARIVAFNRGEMYRQHLFMMYGGSSTDGSPLTPESMLSVAVESPTERELVDPYEVLFIRLEKDFSAVASLAAAPTEKVGSEPHSLLPLMPALTTWEPSHEAYLSGDVIEAPRHADAYMKLQEKYLDGPGGGIGINARAPRNEDEIEYVELVSWLLLRERLFSQFYGKADPLLAVMKGFQPIHKPRDELNAIELTNRCGNGIRCEYSPERGEAPLPSPAPGTVLYFFVDGHEIVLVEPNKAVAEKGKVAFALQTFYTEAIVAEKYQFRLRLVYDSPFFRLNVPLVFRERSICQNAAKKIHAASRAMRVKACVTMTSVLGSPLRADEATSNK